MLEILDVQMDEVVRCRYLTAKSNYRFAIDILAPLVSKFDNQRNPLQASYYKRLEKDIQAGCIMPPITIAIRSSAYAENQDWKWFVLENLNDAFVLDGIQRLTTLKRISTKESFPWDRPIYVNILICDSMDRFLYRMITLNNGQRPMSARHQIEVLAANLFDFDNLPILTVSEKQVKTKGYKKTNEEAMSREIIIKGYLAFISNSINIDNQKIIESKMDELIAEKIMDSNINQRTTEYIDVVNYISRLLENEVLQQWIIIPNNYIGFCASMATEFDTIRVKPLFDIEASIQLFEYAFESIDVSKIKLGLARRRMVKFFFDNFDRFSILSVNRLLDELSMEL